MFGQKQNNQVSISDLAKQLKALNFPVQQSSKELFKQVESINTSIQNKIKQYDQFCNSEELSKLTEIFEKAIEMLSELQQKQKKQLEILEKQKQPGNKGDNWKNIGLKAQQVQMKMNNWMVNNSLLQQIVSIQLELKKLEDSCDDL